MKGQQTNIFTALVKLGYEPEDLREMSKVEMRDLLDEEKPLTFQSNTAHPNGGVMRNVTVVAPPMRKAA